MAERITVNSKKPVSIKENLISHKRKTDFRSNSSPVNRILYLQRTIGNQAVQRMVRSGALQAKLRIGQPGDKYEQEADRVADEVMRMPEPGVQRQVDEKQEEEILQTKPLVDQITPVVQRQVEEEEEEEMLQAKSREDATPEVSNDLESQINAIKGGGRPLAESERAYFEPRFGADFSRVRVHTDTRAADSAQAVNARAFTVGRDIVFGTGQYASETRGGKRILAHELTHTIQQGQAVGNVIQREVGVICDQDALDRARREARRRVLRVHFMLGHMSTEAIRGHALQVAQNIIAPGITVDRLQRVIWYMWQALNSENYLHCGPEIAQCGRGLEWDAYTTVGQNDIHTCNSFFDLDFPDQVRKLIHESAHAAGIGQLEVEAYLMSFDCETTEGDENVADAWAHYIHCVLGFTPDEEHIISVPSQPFWEQFTSTPDQVPEEDTTSESSQPFWEQFTSTPSPSF